MSRNGVGFPSLRDRTMETSHETEDILYSVQNEINDIPLSWIMHYCK